MQKSIPSLNKYLSSFNKQLAVSLAVFGSRINLLPANVSAAGSFGFFGNPILYFLSIFLFDRLVGGLYNGFWLTYIGFAMYPLLGWIAKKKPGSSWYLLPSASFLFFFFSNFGSWYYWYPRTFDGLILCYSLAIPFYARTLVGDLAFGYGYMLLKNARVQKLFSANRNRFIDKYNYLLLNK